MSKELVVYVLALYQKELHSFGGTTKLQIGVVGQSKGLRCVQMDDIGGPSSYSSISR